MPLYVIDGSSSSYHLHLLYYSSHSNNIQLELPNYFEHLDHIFYFVLKNMYMVAFKMNWLVFPDRFYFVWCFKTWQLEEAFRAKTVGVKCAAKGCTTVANLD
ncbi:hypothetical protein CHS0354_038923 [Potamilus streckersoni]|uniref:Uncharacterized protein n=1 Tax=Potamilus streckersoni TaxID=2493646 RepID=A0AAE0S0V0_9BIVA|nr:hypothetical protein CHS0354_038923 [Potamilus streckersoni]